MASSSGGMDAADAADDEEEAVEEKVPQSLLEEGGHLAYEEAAWDNDIIALRGAVTRGNVNTQDKRGLTLLHRAVDYSCTDMARFLLEVGADPNIRRHGADNDATDDDGETPLDWCNTNEGRTLFESAVRRLTQYVCGVARAVDAHLCPHDVVDCIVLEYLFPAKTVNESKAALAEARTGGDEDGDEEE